MVITYALVSVVLVSLLSLTGILALSLNKSKLEKTLMVLVSLSTGTLIGDAVFHLLPETIELSGGMTIEISIYFLVGILIFFSLEKFLRWRHCHDIECTEHPKHLGTMNLVGDGVHNFIDGVLIGSSYLISIPLGIATTIAVILHEVPQELGDFGVLLHSGFTKVKAVIFNFLSGAIAIIGTAFALIMGNRIESFSEALVPVTAGGFVYIALSGLIPELHKEDNIYRSLLQFLFIVVGLAVMYLLLIVSG